MKSFMFAVLFCCGLLLLCTGAAGQDAKKSPQGQAAARAYNAAAALQNKGLHPQAAAKWSGFLKAHPTDERADRAHYYLGVCQLRTKAYPAAAVSFQTVIAKWPKFRQIDGAHYNLAMARYELALVSKKNEDFVAARAAFAAVSSKFPKSDFADDALYFQGDCAYNSGDQVGAIAAFQQLVSQYPQSGQLARAYYDLGLTQQDTGKTAEAAATFKAFLDKQEFKAHELAGEIRLRRAICLYDLDQADAATAEFEQLAKIKDFSFADFALLRFGQAKMASQKWAEAATVLASLPKQFPQSPHANEAQKSAGRCQFEAGNWAAAAALLTPLTNRPDQIAAEASYWLGRTQLKAGQIPQALQTLEAAKNKFKQGEFVPYLHLAWIDALYETPARRKETAALYETFAQTHPKHPLTAQASYMAALASLELEQFAKARKLAEALAAQPEMAASDLYPGVLYVAAEATLLDAPDQATEAINAANAAKAKQLYQQLLAKHPEHPRAGRAHLRIGWIMQSAKQHAEAIAFLNGAVTKLDKSEELPEAHLMVGRCYAATNNHAEAVKSFAAALAANPTWPRNDEVLLNAAQSARQTNNLKAAKQQLQQLVSSHPKSPLRPQALYVHGDICQSESQHDAAIKLFTQLAQEHSDSEFHGPALYGVGAALFAKQDFMGARTWLDKIDGKDAELQQRRLYLRGLVHQRLKDFPKAGADLTAFLATSPPLDQAINARYTLALCHIGQKKFAEAEAVLAQLLKDKPDFEDADKVHYELGHALLEQKDKQAEAAKAFRKLAESLPKSPLATESWFRVGQFHAQVAATATADQARTAELTKAQQAFAAGVAIPDSEKSLREKLRYKLGDSLHQLGKHAEAIAAFKTQLTEFPQGDFVGAARFLQADCYFQTNQFAQALPLFVQVTQDKFPNMEKPQVDQYRSQAIYKAGVSAAKLNNWKESETRFAQLVTEFPKFEQVDEAQYGMARAAQQQKQLPKAVALYEQVTQQTETETAAKARFMIGEIRFGEKKYGEAIEHFLLVAVGYPYEEWQALSRFETARCFMELKDEKRAVQSLREMIDKHPEHPRAKDAQKLLDQLTK